MANEFSASDFKEDEFSQTDFVSQFPRSQFLPGQERVQQLIQQRPGALEGLERELAVPQKIGQTGQDLQSGKIALQAAGIPFRLGEAGLANVGLAVQRGEFSPLELAKEFGRGITGRKFGEFGDIIRTTGFGGSTNELISNIVGFGGVIAAGNIGSKGKITDGLRKMKEANIAKGKFFFKQKADELASGVDDVITGVKKEFDILYNKQGLGVKSLDPKSQLATQDIVNRLPTNILGKIKTKAKISGKPSVGEIVETGEKVILKPNISTAKAIKTEIGGSIPRKVWSGLDEATEVQAKLMDDYFTLNNVIAENAGGLKPDLLRLNKKFSDLMKFNKTIKGLTKKPTGVTKTDIRGILEPSKQGERAVLEDFSNQFFPRTQDIIKEIDRFNKIEKAKQLGGTALKFGVGLEVFRRFGVNPILDAVQGAGGGGRGGFE